MAPATVGDSLRGWPPPEGTVMLVKVGKHARISFVYAVLGQNPGTSYFVRVTHNAHYKVQENIDHQDSKDPNFHCIQKNSEEGEEGEEI